VQHHSFRNNGSLENYNKNLLRSLKHHISRYETYQCNAKKISNEKAIEFGFVIDNTSIMPDLIKRDGKLLIITPFMMPDFVKQIKLNKWIKHIFYIFTNMSKRQILYVYVGKNNFKYYEDDCNHVQLNDEYVQLKAESLSVNLIIPRKKGN